MDTDEPADLTDIGGVDGDTAEALRRAGYETTGDLQAATESELVDIEGLSKPLAARIVAKTGADEGTGDSSAEQQETESGSVEFSFLGLQWYHYGMVILLSGLYLQSNLIVRITVWNVLLALVATFGLVVGLTTLYRAFID